MIIGPVMMNIGVVPPPPGYLDGLATLLHGVEAAERDDVHEGGDLGWHRTVLADRRRLVGGAELVGRRVHRHLHRVVVAVVGALDLDDVGAAGHRPHQVDGGHRRFGAGVGEAPQRQAEAAGQLGGDRDDVGRRLGEVRAVRDALADGAHDRRVGVAGQHRAEAAVEVDVLGAIDVPHPAAGAALEEDRARRGVLPRRGHAAGEVGAGLDEQLVRSPGAGYEGCLLDGDQAVQGVEVPTADLVDDGHA
jgi:hypothetical protein